MLSSPSSRIRGTRPFGSRRPETSGRWRVGSRHRALAVEVDDGLVWFCIGSQAEYDRLLG